MRVAAIDCGTNSIRLLVSSEGRDVTRLNEIVRLGQGVDATGRLSEEALGRTRAALERYVALMEEEGVEKVRMVATSATRDAENKEEFFEMTEQLLGVRAEVISGEQEAALSFAGAVGDLDPADGPFCVIDLGGGSTEFIVGEADGTIVDSHSAQMGCVRITEKIMRSDPPTPTEIEIARDYIDERLDEVFAAVSVDKAKTFVGVAGTFTTLSALAQGLESYNPAEIHRSVLRFDALSLLIDQLVATPSAERALNPVIHPGRADVIGGGAIVVDTVMKALSQRVGAECFVISEKDILDGIVESLVR